MPGDYLFIFLQRVHSKQANRPLKPKELLLFLQTDHSKQANRVLKRKELLKRKI